MSSSPSPSASGRLCSSPISVVVRTPTLSVALAVPTVLILVAATGWPLESK